MFFKSGHYCLDIHVEKTQQFYTETRLQFRGRGYLYYYCNQHGLFKKSV